MTVSQLHGAFSGQLKDLLAKIRGNIEDGIKAYKATPEILKTAASNIQSLDDARIYFKDVLNRKQPDGSYYSEDCEQREPSFALEVNWSRYNGDQLAERAQELINLSDGKIRTVVNVDLNEIYEASNKGKSLRSNQEGPAAATVSVWRARATDIDGHQVTVPERDYHEVHFTVLILACFQVLNASPLTMIHDAVISRCRWKSRRHFQTDSISQRFHLQGARKYASWL